VVVAEFYAFQDLGRLIRGGMISERAAAITTYAMCGFSNPAAAGITLAVFSNLCPQRRKDFSDLVLRAFLSGMAANMMTACIAGALLDQGDLSQAAKAAVSGKCPFAKRPCIDHFALRGNPSFAGGGLPSTSTLASTVVSAVANLTSSTPPSAVVNAG